MYRNFDLQRYEKKINVVFFLFIVTSLGIIANYPYGKPSTKHKSYDNHADLPFKRQSRTYIGKLGEFLSFPLCGYILFEKPTILH